jgi:hypothetical protein
MEKSVFRDCSEQILKIDSSARLRFARGESICQIIQIYANLTCKLQMHTIESLKAVSCLQLLSNRGFNWHHELASRQPSGQRISRRLGIFSALLLIHEFNLIEIF